MQLEQPGLQERPEEPAKKGARKLTFIVVMVIGIAVLSALAWPDLARKPDEGRKRPPAAEASLPVWAPGDSWTYMNTAGNTFRFTMEGEENFQGTPAYRLTGTIDPPLENWASQVRWVYEKSTLTLLENTVWGTDRSRITYYSRVTSDNLWPLSENKSYEENVLITRHGTEGIEVLPDETSSASYRVSVEDFENITVPAGTFECYRISTRTLEGSPVEDRWYSGVVKNFVRIVNHQYGENFDLFTYEISQVP